MSSPETLMNNLTSALDINNQQVLHRSVRASGNDDDFLARKDNLLGQIVADSAPYLFPCVIEYSLICAAITYVMWKNCGKSPHLRKIVSVKDRKEEDKDKVKTSESFQVDCAGANKGLFAGLLVMCGTVVSLIIFFVLVNNDKYIEKAIIEACTSEIILYVLSLVAASTGLNAMRKMQYDDFHSLELDSILLVIAQTGLYTYAIFVVIAGYFLEEEHNNIMLVAALICFVQATVQTMFILDGSKRYASTEEEYKNKPGREMVTFLILCNLSMWAVNTFETSRAAIHKTEIQFFGEWAWVIIQHFSMPLAIFYRFHSTVCLCEIWTHAYEYNHRGHVVKQRQKH